ncbi:MAG: PEP-CTERM sorting domain-containing protein [Planctomycetota bacterium]
MRIRSILAVPLLSAVCWLPGAHAATVNVDFDGFSGGGTYVGDDGVLSSPGADNWNSILPNESGVELDDEFGNASPITVNFSGPLEARADENATNLLQDTGVIDTGLTIRGVDIGTLYDIAVYVFDLEGVSVGGVGTPLGVTPTYQLPGVERVAGATQGDYFLFRDVAPVFLGRGGSSGIVVDTGASAIAGLQIRVVPEPASVILLGLAASLLMRRDGEASRQAP